MRKNSIKNTRINGEVQRELSNIIRGEIKDPRINPLTSVVAVEVAPDLKTCKAYISVLGDEESQAKTLAGLKSAEGFIRSKLDFEFVMVTNQDGLGTSSFPEDTFWPVHNLVLKTLEGEGIIFDDILIDRSFRKTMCLPVSLEQE